MTVTLRWICSRLTKAWRVSVRDYAQMRVVTSHKLSFNSPNMRTSQHSISYDIAVSIIEKALKSVKEDTVSQYESIRMESLRLATHKNQATHRWIELSPFNALQTDTHSKTHNNSYSVFDSLRHLQIKRGIEYQKLTIFFAQTFH
jgi:hypothetical protein